MADEIERPFSEGPSLPCQPEGSHPLPQFLQVPVVLDAQPRYLVLRQVTDCALIATSSIFRIVSLEFPRDWSAASISPAFP
jgi:hypothetical protein